MLKLIASPLLWVLIGLGVSLIVLRNRVNKLGTVEKDRIRLPWWFAFSLTATLALLSMPVVSATLARTPEGALGYPGAEVLRDLDVVTVLAGGVRAGVGPESSALVLNEYSYMRTFSAVRAYRLSGAEYLVIQGRVGGGDPARMVSQMRDLAVAMSVDEGRIVLEPRSRNTREHPIELLELVEGNRTLKVGVVTSVWHLPRALDEFRRHFDFVVPIPADSIAMELRGDVTDWIPQSIWLHRSTLVINEWVGRLWYAFRRF